ncbi:DnaJ domain [Phytophthora cactorum]|nr:DnaJ domain [Phytophthora cactorum]
MALEVLLEVQLPLEPPPEHRQFMLLSGQEPVDTLEAFRVRHSQTLKWRYNMLVQICQGPRVVCRREVPKVYSTQIQAPGASYRARRKSDDTECSVCSASCGVHKVQSSDALEDCGRRRGTQIGKLEIYDDVEPVDQIYKFIKDHKLPMPAVDQLLGRIVARDDETGEPRQLGALQIPLGQEPADVCDDKYVTCKRLKPIIFASPVQVENGTTVGVLMIREDEELVDAVHRFSRQTNITRDLQVSLFQALCGIEREFCALEVKHFFDLRHTRFVNIYEGQEPADVVYQFAEQHNLAPGDRDVLLDSLCSPPKLAPVQEEDDEDETEPLNCSRYAPVVFRVPVAAQNGSQLGILEVLANEEPADAVTRFGKTHELGPEEKKSIVTGVCQASGLGCTRDVGILYETIYTLPDGRRERLPFYDGQDSTDVIYEYGLMRNLTLRQRQKSSSKDRMQQYSVECSRMQPRRTLFSVQATYAGLSHTLEYVRPESDWICDTEPHGGQRCVHYVEILAKKFCERHMYDWAACESRILEALRQQLEFYEIRMWKAKDMYAKLGLVKTASREQIDAAYNTLVKRFNNETEPYKYDKLKEAYRVLSDPEEKYYYDLPCVKLFGCLCGKRQKDGGITFTPD